MTNGFRLPLALALTLAVAPLALAEHEALEAHARGTTKTVTLDNQDVHPSSLQMQHGDVISFLNYSTHPVRVTFTDPKDLEKRIRCGLVHAAKTAPAAPWALFTWEDGKLVGNVPPGQFASVCSLEPGAYSFTAEIIGVKTSEGSSLLPHKGNIEVK